MEDKKQTKPISLEKRKTEINLTPELNTTISNALKSIKAKKQNMNMDQKNSEIKDGQ